MKLVIKNIILFLMICLYTQAVMGQSPYILKPDSDHWALGQTVEILTDTLSNVDFQEVIEAYHDDFIPISQVENVQNLSIDHIWLRVTLLNKSSSEKFILTLDNWDEVKIYFHDSLGRLEMHRTGVTYALNDREVLLGRFIHLPLTLHHHKATVVYLRCSQVRQYTKGLNSTFNFYKRLELKTDSSARKVYFIKSVFYGFNIGILLIIIIYKLMLFIYIRDITYFYFVLLLSFTTIAVGIESGFLEYYLFNQNPESSSFYYSTSLTISFVFLLLFARSYLRLVEFLPKLNRFVIFLIWLQITSSLLSFFNIISALMTLFIFIMVIFSAFYISIRSAMTGFKPAKYFLLADSIYLLAWLVNMLTSTGVIPYDFYIEPFNIGNLTQITLFSLGLAYRFKVMQVEVKNHKEEKQKLIEQQKEQLEIEVERQTKHIQDQNNEIQVQNEELYQQREEILAQRDFVEGKNKELEKVNQRLNANEQVLKKSYEKLRETQNKVSQKNKELEERDQHIRSSINAALSIQTAILPYSDRLTDILGEHFVIYKPKDIVSGDFYWLDIVDQKRIIITADCTGHGVPGALMSMIGNNVMDKVISMKNNTHPSEILEEIHKEVVSTLKQKETNNNNGMDMSVLVLENFNNGLTLARFAGAKSSMYFKYPQEKEIIEVKGSRRSIGGIQNLNTTFETREIILSPQTLVYMGSDGYADQNNKKRKRIGEKKLKKLLIEIAHLPLTQQKEFLEKHLKDHMQDTQQRDDILLMGFKL